MIKRFVVSFLVGYAIGTLFFQFIAHASVVHVVSSQAHVDIKTSKVIHLKGPIVPRNMEKAMREGGATETLPGDRVILINSPGGQVDLGTDFINAMIQERTKQHEKIICVVDKNAHSMAFNILTYCDVRLFTPGSRMVVHKIAAVIGCEENQNLRFTSKTLRGLADDLQSSDEEFRVNNAKAMGISLKDYDLFADSETAWRGETLLNMGYLQGTATLTYE